METLSEIFENAMSLLYSSDISNIDLARHIIAGQVAESPEFKQKMIEHLNGRLFVSKKIELDVIDVDGCPTLYISTEGNCAIRFLNFYSSAGELRIPFKRVGGNFEVGSKSLRSLKGCPEFVGGNFDCSCAALTNLEGAPRYIGGNFDCQRNKITTLEHGPDYVGMDYNCDENELSNLKGVPPNFTGRLYCGASKLDSLEGCPEILESLCCNYNSLTNLSGSPRLVRSYFNCKDNPITTLSDGPVEVYGTYDCSETWITTLDGAPTSGKYVLIFNKTNCSFTLGKSRIKFS